MVKSRLMEWAGHVARTWEKTNAYRKLVGKPVIKRPLGGPRHGCVDNIKMDLGDIGWGGMDWNDLDQDRDKCRTIVEDNVMNLRVSKY
jgi:hypothetical protein